MKQDITPHSPDPVSFSDVSAGGIPEPTVYRGTMLQNLERQQPTRMPGGNRGVAKRKRSTFNLMLILLGCAFASVLYISNVIRVNLLLAEVNRLQMQHRRIQMDQELLRAQINQISSMERIRKIAEENLGLVIPQSPPILMTVDPQRIRALESASAQRKSLK